MQLSSRTMPLGMPSYVPSVELYNSDRLEVGDGYRLYWEAVGNPAGVPAAFLHGGPGSGPVRPREGSSSRRGFGHSCSTNAGVVAAARWVTRAGR